MLQCFPSSYPSSDFAHLQNAGLSKPKTLYLSFSYDMGHWLPSIAFGSYLEDKGSELGLQLLAQGHAGGESPST